MTDPRRRPGGQGINVTRAVRALGGRSTAVALLGGRTGAELRALLEHEGTPLVAVECDDETRTFVAARERATGRSMLLNARGPARTPDDADRLSDVVGRVIAEQQPAWVACCGSLPTSFPDDTYAHIARRAQAAGCRVVIDCDGSALRTAAGDADLLVPNRHEAERLANTSIHDVRAAADVARQLLELRAAHVAITIGADGAVLASADGAWHAHAPPVHHGSAVGAGDVFLAALLLALAREQPDAERLRFAVAAATAALRSQDASIVDPVQIAATDVEVAQIR